MVWAPGESGNPQGKHKQKLWREALLRALNRASDERGTALERIADRVVADACDGSYEAWREIADRLDGKSVQAQEISGPDGGDIPTGVRVIFVRPNDVLEAAAKVIDARPENPAGV